jgi:hypothetical protein
MSYSNQIQYEDVAAVTVANESIINADGLYVGSDGNVTLSTRYGDITFTGVKSGTIIPIYCKKVKATTTATGIVALYCNRRQNP